MAKTIKKSKSEYADKTWREAEMIKAFNLTRIVAYPTPLMKEWLDVQPPQLSIGEQYVFDKTFSKGQQSVSG